MKKHIRTVLEPGLYLTKVKDSNFGLLVYRNSDSPKEGLTIPRSELKRYGVPSEALEVGVRFKMAIEVPGSDQMPLVQFHMNKRGGYITGPVVDHHESMGHLPLPRIQMGDRRRGSDYKIMVGSLQWFIETPAENQIEVPVETLSEPQSETTFE